MGKWQWLNGDREDVQKAQRGDMEAFGRLITKHTQTVRRFVGRWLQETDIDDIIQITWLKALKALEKFKGESNFSTWVCRIAINTLLDDKRKPDRGYPFSFLDESGGHFLERTPDTLIDEQRPDRAISTREYHQRRIKWLTWALQQLSEDHRTVITLQFIEWLSYQQIADKMNCSIGTIMSRRFYAMQKLWAMAQKHNSNWDTPEE